MNREIKGYIAGLIDGEGTITFHRYIREKWQTNRPFMSICNNNRQCLEFVKKHTKLGLIHLTNKSTKNVPNYRLSFSPNEMRELLPQIEPFLIVKKDQSRLLRKILSVIRCGRNAYSNKDKFFLDAAVKKMRKLNARGKNV